ncbi:MAG: hypothetical protein JWL72_1574, partial [Ilumatobacteraceae bacterium]|nr:hypothetical protein [Ilumatobacteraceae bacterium]
GRRADGRRAGGRREAGVGRRAAGGGPDSGARVGVTPLMYIWGMATDTPFDAGSASSACGPPSSRPAAAAAATAGSAAGAPAATGYDSRIVERRCGWCTNRFVVVRRPGRPLIYCKQSCRQRAYERRRGLGVLPPPDRIVTRPGGPLAHLRPRPGAYEMGRIRYGADPGKLHAMRPAGITDVRGRRLTLCGLLARPVTRDFAPGREESCLTCELVTRVRPSARPIRLTEDLAALRSLIDVAAVEMSRSQASQHEQRPPGDILAELLLAV